MDVSLHGRGRATEIIAVEVRRNVPEIAAPQVVREADQRIKLVLVQLWSEKGH